MCSFAAIGQQICANNPKLSSAAIGGVKNLMDPAVGEAGANAINPDYRLESEWAWVSLFWEIVEGVARQRSNSRDAQLLGRALRILS